MKKHIILIVLFTLFAGMTTLSAQDERLVQDSLKKEISEIRRSGHFYFQEKRDEDKEVAREEALSMLKHDVKDSLASMLSSKKEIEELMEILEENVSQISYRAYGSDSYRVFLYLYKS